MQGCTRLVMVVVVMALVVTLVGCDEQWWLHGRQEPAKADAIAGEIVAEGGGLVDDIVVSVVWFSADPMTPDVSIPDEDEYFEEDGGVVDSVRMEDAEGSGSSVVELTTSDDDGASDDTCSDDDETEMCPGIYDIDFDDFEVCDGSMGAYGTETCREVGNDIYASKGTLITPAEEDGFTLSLNRKPPAGARTSLEDIGGTGWYASGILVGFSDQDGDLKFDQGTPDRVTDEIRYASYTESEERYYLAWVVYLRGRFPDDDMMVDWFGVPLAQGMNVIVEVETPDSEDVYLLGPGETAKLYAPTPLTGSELAYLQCEEIEYRREMNVPLPEDAPAGCMMIGNSWEDENGDVQSQSIAQWMTESVNPENSCVVDVQSGAVCFTDESQLPEEWTDICGGDYL